MSLILQLNKITNLNFGGKQKKMSLKLMLYFQCVSRLCCTCTFFLAASRKNSNSILCRTKKLDFFHRMFKSNCGNTILKVFTSFFTCPVQGVKASKGLAKNLWHFLFLKISSVKTAKRYIYMSDLPISFHIDLIQLSLRPLNRTSLRFCTRMRLQNCNFKSDV